MAALRLSIRYGHGDLHWWERQSPEDQALLLAYERLQARPGPATGGGGDAVLRQHLEALRPRGEGG